MPQHHPDAFRRQLLLGALACGLLAGGCSRSAKPQGKMLASDANLLCLGDSLTFGFGAGAGASYPQKLEQLSGHVTQNAGVNGDTAEGALARLPGLLQSNQPGLVLVSIGANDFLRQLPLQRTRDALTQIVQIASASAQVVLIAQPRPVLMALASGSVQDHPVYAEVAAETGVPLYAGGWSEVLSRAELRSDQIHANAQGYALFAERLAQWLRESGFIGQT
ncbi:MAG: GDSL-type esterase/lipase family protein [Pseudomonadota bacterium]|nr:GDSL-type esterase/lipase family protein [Pseudomonadota bacterium]